MFSRFQAIGMHIKENRIRKRKAFFDDCLRFLAPFWEAFGRQNLEKRLSDIRRTMDAFWEAILENKWAARRDARSGRKLEFGRIEAGTFGKIQSTRPTCLKAGGGGFNRFAHSAGPLKSEWRIGVRHLV